MKEIETYERAIILTLNGAKMLDPVAMADEADDAAGTGALIFWRLTSGAPLSECGILAESGRNLDRSVANVDEDVMPLFIMEDSLREAFSSLFPCQLDRQLFFCLTFLIAISILASFVHRAYFAGLCQCTVSRTVFASTFYFISIPSHLDAKRSDKVVFQEAFVY